LTIKEGRAMVNAARQHNRVFQTGSMQRSWPEFRQAVELVRNGYIGKLEKVVCNVAGAPQSWDLKAEVKPDDLNWDMWLGPNTIERPFNSDLAPDLVKEAKIWPRWRWYEEFGGGGMTDWGAHMFDIAQWGMDMDNSGPVKINIREAGFDKEKQVVFEYKNGIELVHFSQPGQPFCHFMGTEGSVWVARRELRTDPWRLKTHKIGDTEKRVYFSDNHYVDFLNCIKTRQKPICDVEVGHRTATVCSLGNIAYKLGRSLVWNPKKEQIIGDAQASALLSRPMKKEWIV
jgi:predicted dehydrogenase